MFDINEERLCRLFIRHTDGNASAAGAIVAKLQRHLSQLPMKFTPLLRIGEVEFPTIPPGQLPSFIYYFIPGTKFGSHKPQPPTPTDYEFPYSADGIGMNLGCPVRLVQALEVLNRLSPIEQQEIKRNIAVPRSHLSTVEELLWLRGWKAQTNCRRGGTLHGKKDVDWFFRAAGEPVYLEAKFRPAFWPILTDEGTFRPTPKSLLRESANKFPLKRKEQALHLVGMTGPSNQEQWFAHAFGSELTDNPQIDAVVYRSLISMTHVLSLKQGVVSKVMEILSTLRTRALPTNYFVPFLSEAQKERVNILGAKPATNKPQISNVICRGLEPEIDASASIPPPDFFKLNIKGHTTDGEPLFEIIPRLIPAPATK